jgi:hypothetical protein
MTFSLKNSIASAGSTAIEVLDKSPGIIIDRQNNSIAMGGIGGLLIMINGNFVFA